MNVSTAIHLKRAVRNFKDDPLPEDVIVTILNSGRRAQSSKNSQPWHFIAVTSKSVLQQISTCGEWAGHLANAALGVVIVHPNPEEKIQILFDIGQAAAYMQLAAWEKGVGSCLATIYEQDRIREILEIPNNWHSRFAISFGYPLENENLSAPPKKGGRVPLDKIVHWDKW